MGNQEKLRQVALKNGQGFDQRLGRAGEVSQPTWEDKMTIRAIGEQKETEKKT